MSDDGVHASPPSRAGSVLGSAEAELLEFLGKAVGLRVTAEDARRKWAAVDERGEPLARLIAAAQPLGLLLVPVRRRLVDLIWSARDSQPVVCREPGSGRWLVIRGHGFFRAKVVRPDVSDVAVSVGRASLASLLGLPGVEAEVEAAHVAPLLPAQGLSGKEEDAEASLLPGFLLRRPKDGHEASPAARFLGLLRPEMADIGTLVVFSLITGLLYLAVPLAVNGLVSNLAFGTQSAPFQQALLFIAAALFGCLLLSAVMRGLQYLVAEHVQCRIFVRVAADMAWRLPRVKAESVDGEHAPEMVNRFLDVVTVQKSTSLLLLNGINIVIGALIGLVVLAFYHPFLLAYMVVMLVAIALIVFVLGRGAVRTSVAESRGKYAVVNWLEDVARYPRLFKGPGGYALAAERADRLARSYLAHRAAHFRILMRQVGGLLALEVLASSALLVVGGGLVLSQQLTLGQLVAAELIVSAVVASIAKLGKQFEAWYDALAAVDKLGHLVDLETERVDGDVPPGAPASGASVVAKGLRHAYPGGREVLRAVDFELPAGGRLAVSGPQGSGCSTLLDLLAGMREPSSGSILVDGLDLRSWSLESLRSRVMLLRSQDIFNGTVADNVGLSLPGVGLEQVQDALARAGLLDDVLAMPQGLSTPLVTGGLPLSSRQRNRLLIARALLLRPRLLLLDELLDGLDPATSGAMLDIILDPSCAWTVVAATRDPAVAARFPSRLSLQTPAP